MFEIKNLDFSGKNLDFVGNNGFDEILDKIFSDVERTLDDDGVPVVRVHLPKKGDPKVSSNNDSRPAPIWHTEVRSEEIKEKPLPETPDYSQTPAPAPKEQKEPKSLIEMLEDGDERLEKLIGKIIDKKLADRNIPIPDPEVKVSEKNPFVYIANRLTFLIQTKFPIVFDTSIIKVDEKSMTIAVNEDKTIPKLNHIDELGFITSEVNRDEDIRKELEEYLEDTGYGSIYCFPSVTRDEGEDGEEVYAVKFVIYSKK